MAFFRNRKNKFNSLFGNLLIEDIDGALEKIKTISDQSFSDFCSWSVEKFASMPEENVFLLAEAITQKNNISAEQASTIYDGLLTLAEQHLKSGELNKAENLASWTLSKTKTSPEFDANVTKKASEIGHQVIEGYLDNKDSKQANDALQYWYTETPANFMRENNNSDKFQEKNIHVIEQFMDVLQKNTNMDSTETINEAIKATLCGFNMCKNLECENYEPVYIDYTHKIIDTVLENDDAEWANDIIDNVLERTKGSNQPNNLVERYDDVIKIFNNPNSRDFDLALAHETALKRYSDYETNKDNRNALRDCAIEGLINTYQEYEKNMSEDLKIDIEQAKENLQHSFATIPPEEKEDFVKALRDKTFSANGMQEDFARLIEDYAEETNQPIVNYVQPNENKNKKYEEYKIDLGPINDLIKNLMVK